MTWTVTTDLTRFDGAVRPWLEQDPIEHTVPLTLLSGLLGGVRWSEQEPVYAWHRTAGTTGATVDGVALTTPPYPLLLSGAFELGELAARLEAHPLTGVNSTVSVAQAFAAGWRTAHQVTVAERMRLRLFALDVLVPPPPGPGHARTAGPDDAQVVHHWTAAMRDEIRERGPAPREVMTARIAAGAVWLWEAGGQPVAMASSTVPVAGVSRIATVYTPPAFRRQGFAANVTAACTSGALVGGAANVCLFTDAGNPTSNSLYRRLGYRHRSDRVVLSFAGPSRSQAAELLSPAGS